jgi:4-amino-4-deoxy-L-arabinose transferase-like glycosyltransferase
VSVPRLSRSSLLLSILLGASLLHFGIGWVLGLSGDEAHYALYAAHPALSYYDHPPLVGWVQWPLVALGAPDGVLRLIPELLWLGTALLVHALALRLHALVQPAAGSAQAAGLWAVLAYSLAPLLHVLGIGLLPDTLLMFFTAALMLQTLRMLDAAQAQRWGNWLGLGALLGLAGLAKYTAIFAALPVAACLLAAHGPGLLRRTAPWLALLLAVVLVLPVFIWNAQHDWASFRYQLHHGAGSHWRVGQLLGFLLAQLLLYPLLLWGIFGLRRRVLGGTGLRAPWVWLLSFALLPFVVLAYLSGGGSSLPHWTAPAWVALAPWVGIGLAALWASGRRRLIWVLGAVQALFCVVLYVFLLTAGPIWLRNEGASEPVNPFTDFYGWDTAGARAQQLAREHQVARLAVQNWTLASRLAWYARPLPVHVIAPGQDQFSFWSGELQQGASALLMDWSQMAYKLPLGPGQFERCEPADSFAVERAGRPIARFSFYLCHGWGGQPAPRRLDEP